VYVETEKLMLTNVGCVLTGEGPVMIDAPIDPEEAVTWRKQAEQMSDKEIAYVVATDHHYDHALNCSLMGKRIIAHDVALRGIQYLQTRENLENEMRNQIGRFLPVDYDKVKDKFENIEVALPQITFSRSLTLQMGDRKVELTFVGGHSPGTITVYIPEERVFFAGDALLEGYFPATDVGRFAPWIEMLQKMEEMEIDTIVPGHGSLCGKELATRVRVYFEQMRDRIRPLVTAGVIKEEIVKNVDLSDVTPIPYQKEHDARIAFDVGNMYDQIVKGQV
jgi:cyclase